MSCFYWKRTSQRNVFNSSYNSVDLPVVRSSACTAWTNSAKVWVKPYCSVGNFVTGGFWRLPWYFCEAVLRPIGLMFALGAFRLLPRANIFHTAAWPTLCQIEVRSLKLSLECSSENCHTWKLWKSSRVKSNCGSQSSRLCCYTGLKLPPPNL